VYISRNYKGVVEINDESKKATFFSVQSIPTEISPPVIPIVKEFLNRMHTKPH
jgi:ribose 5-phosphate isomerase